MVMMMERFSAMAIDDQPIATIDSTRNARVLKRKVAKLEKVRKSPSVSPSATSCEAHRSCWFFKKRI